MVHLGRLLRMGVVEATYTLIYSMPWLFCAQHENKVAWNSRDGRKLPHEERKGQVHNL